MGYRMRVWIKRSGFVSLLLIVALVFISSCGEKKKEDITHSEVELFAKAQELQKNKKHSEAVEIYRQITRDFPKTKQGANSQFMIGYTYANDIKDYEQARIDLNRFLETYSDIADAGLIEGAKFEIENLGKNIDEIPILIQSEEVKDTTASNNEEVHD